VSAVLVILIVLLTCFMSIAFLSK